MESEKTSKSVTTNVNGQPAKKEQRVSPADAVWTTSDYSGYGADFRSKEHYQKQISGLLTILSRCRIKVGKLSSVLFCEYSLASGALSSSPKRKPVVFA